MEIVVDSNKRLSETLNRVYKNEDRLIMYNSFYGKIFRKGINDNLNSVKARLLEDLTYLARDEKTAFLYVEKNLTGEFRQFMLRKLDRVYGKGFSNKFYDINTLGEWISTSQSQIGNLQNPQIYICKKVPETEYNLHKSKELLESAIARLKGNNSI